MDAATPLHFRSALCDALLARPASPTGQADPNRPLFASLIAGRQLGLGCLPAHLGLGETDYARLLASHFSGEHPATRDGLAEAIPELEDIERLLLDFRAGERESEIWMARILAAGCAGRDHLWQDLGLSNRTELSRIMTLNFPGLAAANTGDMKWKKFLYKQFCARDGIYVCPAPSCGVCADYAKCFAPEV